VLLQTQKSRSSICLKTKRSRNCINVQSVVRLSHKALEEKLTDLCESRKLVNTKELSSIQSFKPEFNCRAAMGMPAALLLANPGDTVLWQEREMATVQKLQQEHEHIITHNAHRNDLLLSCCCSCGCCSRSTGLGLITDAMSIQHVRITTEDHPEKWTPSCQHTFVCVDMPSFHCECHITERLSIHQQAQEIF
jgi:hypothetical protein